MSAERLDFDDGKYTVINDNGTLTALRYGQPWARDLVGDNLVYWMFVEVRNLKEQRDELLAALKMMEARFGSTSSRAEEQPTTYGCHHMAETCSMCEGLVTGWKAVQAARSAIAKATGGQ